MKSTSLSERLDRLTHQTDRFLAQLLEITPRTLLHKAMLWLSFLVSLYLLKSLVYRWYLLYRIWFY